MNRGAHAVLGLWTLLRIAIFVGLFFGLLACTISVAFYGERYELGYFIAQPFFFALMMSFVTLVGYLPYRALARRGWFGLHRIHYEALK
jgi:hypothetical protein